MELHLAETKTGARTVSLSPEAVRVLAGIPRSDGNPWVIQGRKTGERLYCIDRHWRLVRERAKLGDVRIHDCRHSLASRALALGESLTARPCRDHGALCPSGPGLNVRSHRAGRRQHRGRYPVAQNLHPDMSHGRRPEADRIRSTWLFPICGRCLALSASGCRR